MVLPFVLGALQYAPSIFNAGREIVEAVTGREVPSEATRDPDTLASYVGTLSPDQQRQIASQLLDKQLREQELDSERFRLMTEGDADKIRATARPQIALRAMGTIESMVRVFIVVFYVAILEFAARVLWSVLTADEMGASLPFPVELTLWDIFAKAEPVTELFWPLVVGAFWASVSVIRKYMGCRERDKAREAEVKAGRPLSANAATIEAAGGFVSSAVRMVKELRR